MVEAGSIRVMMSRDVCSALLAAAARLEWERTMRLTIAAARTARAVVVHAGGAAVRAGHKQTRA